MRITGSPGSYGPVRLENPYVRVIRGMPLRNCDVLVTYKRVVYGFSTGFLQGFYSFAMMFWRRGRKNPYGYRTVHVRAPLRSRTCLRTPVELYDHCKCLLREKNMCMHNFQTRAAYGYKGSISYDHPRVTGILALTVPVNYPGAPCDLGIIRTYTGFKMISQGHSSQ